jgi:RNA polymerase sigma factor (sigma-70 family)
VAIDRPLTPEQAALAARYFKLAMWLGWRFARRHDLDADEVHRYLHEALCLIARDVDPRRIGKPGRTYFSRGLRNALVDYLRHERRRGRLRVTRSLDDPGPYAADRDLFLATGDRDPWTLGDREHVESLLRRLPTDRVALLRRHYLGGEPREEIARDLGVALRTVDQRMLRALNRLRDLAFADGAGLINHPDAREQGARVPVRRRVTLRREPIPSSRKRDVEALRRTRPDDI